MISNLSEKLTGLLGPNSKIVKTIQPAYANFLDRLASNHGLSWSVNGEPVRIHPRVRRFVPKISEPTLFNFLKGNIKTGQTILDVGSFLGTYAVFAARWVGPTGRVVAFEPTLDNHDIITAHLRFNNVSEYVQLVGAAVGKEVGVAEFFQYLEPYMNKMSSSQDDSSDAIVTKVQVVTLDEICAKLEVRPHWIRMDVQGFELDVLQGAREVLKEGRGRLRIVAEMHPQFWPKMGLDEAKATNILTELGLRARALEPGAAPFEPDGHAELEYI